MIEIKREILLRAVHYCVLKIKRHSSIINIAYIVLKCMIMNNNITNLNYYFIAVINFKYYLTSFRTRGYWIL